MQLLPKISVHFFSQTHYKNVQIYQVEFFVLILHQILITNLQGKCVTAGGENKQPDLEI